MEICFSNRYQTKTFWILTVYYWRMMIRHISDFDLDLKPVLPLSVTILTPERKLSRCEHRHKYTRITKISVLYLRTYWCEVPPISATFFSSTMPVRDIPHFSLLNVYWEVNRGNDLKIWTVGGETCKRCFASWLCSHWCDGRLILTDRQRAA